MSLIESHSKTSSPRTHESWLKMWHAIMKAIIREGEKFIVWDNMSVDNCNYHEQIAVELEYFEVASIFRDNINKCYDYKAK